MMQLQPASRGSLPSHHLSAKSEWSSEPSPTSHHSYTPTSLPLSTCQSSKVGISVKSSLQGEENGR